MLSRNTARLQKQKRYATVGFNECAKPKILYQRATPKAVNAQASFMSLATGAGHPDDEPPCPAPWAQAAFSICRIRTMPLLGRSLFTFVRCLPVVPVLPVVSGAHSPARPARQAGAAPTPCRIVRSRERKMKHAATDHANQASTVARPQRIHAGQTPCSRQGIDRTAQTGSGT